VQHSFGKDADNKQLNEKSGKWTRSPNGGIE